MAEREETMLEHGWGVTRHAPSDPQARWIDVAKVPTVIHLDLMALDQGHPEKIADPFLDLNEFDARWVADVRWTYACHFRSPDYITKRRIDNNELPKETTSKDTPKETDRKAGDHPKVAQQETVDNESRTRRTRLVFKGLDTLTTVTLNGAHLLNTDNMFVEYTADVTDRLCVDPEEENVLLVTFEPARLAGLDRVSYGTRHEYHVHQTEVGRAAIRKAQYQWGWDWGPVLNTAGPWQPVLLDSYDCCIDKVRIWTHLSEDLEKGRVTANVSIRGSIPRVRLRAEIILHSGEMEAESVEEIDIDLSKAESVENVIFTIAHPELWWPVGYGSQAMYTMHLTLLPSLQGLTTSEKPHGEDLPGQQAPEKQHHWGHEIPLDRAEKTFGFRRSRLIQQPDSLGTSFYLQINGVDIFAGGSNWIPPDAFLRKPDYGQLFDLLADSHQTMIRVWGGGIYESDDFYHMCDTRGILVWQDFAFACASYPANDAEFLQSVEIEARQNVARLQRHPSLVIWAGNNEDYQIKEHYDLQYDSTSLGPLPWLTTKFPARYIYEYMLPRIVSEEYGAHEGNQAVPYQPGCPYGDSRSTTLKVDPSIGDIHQWDVWHGAMKHYQEYPSMGGRFVSEFGMQAYPHFDTLNRTISGEDELGRNCQLWPGSVTMDVRNKATGHQFRLLKYVAENFRIRELDDPITFGHLTQITQADAVACAYKNWRRLWRNRQCGGVLIWQLNDCWPTVSWSVVDYYGVAKPALYAIKRAMAPLSIAVQRKFHDWTTRKAGNGWQRDTGHVEPHLSSIVHYNVWVASSQLEEEEICHTVVRFVSIETGQDVIPEIKVSHNVSPNTITPILVDRQMLSEEREDRQSTKEKPTGKKPAGRTRDQDAQQNERFFKPPHGFTRYGGIMEGSTGDSSPSSTAVADTDSHRGPSPVLGDYSGAAHTSLPRIPTSFSEARYRGRHNIRIEPNADSDFFHHHNSSAIPDPNPGSRYLSASRDPRFNPFHDPYSRTYANQLRDRPFNPFISPSFISNRPHDSDIDLILNSSPSSASTISPTSETGGANILHTENEPRPASSSGDEDNEGTESAAKQAKTGWSTQLLRSLTPCVIHVALYDHGNDLVSTDTSWPDPIKYLEFHDRRVVLNLQQLKPDMLNGSVSVTAHKPVKGFVFMEKAGGVKFSDNGFDVIPGEVHVVFVQKPSVDGPWPPLEYTYVGRDIWG